MAIQYIGPSRLRRSIEEAYEQVPKEYERENPYIIVGIPHAFSMHREVNEQIMGFSSRRALHDYADHRIRALENMVRKTQQEVSAGKKKFTKLFEELGKAGFVTDKKKNMLACYVNAEDAVFLDVFAATLYHLGPLFQTQKNFEFRDIPGQLRHELVHYDLGVSIPCSETKKYLQEAIFIAECAHQTRKLAQEDPAGLEHWLSSEDAQRYFDRMQAAHDLYGGEAPVKETKKLLDLENEVRTTITKLGLLIAEEALAYGVVHDKNLFITWLRNEHFLDMKDGIALYEHYQQRLAAQGTLATIKELRQSIDTAYTEQRDIATVVLA